MKNNNFFDLKLPDKILGVDKYFLTLFLPPLGLLVVFIISLNLILVPRIGDIGTTKDQIKTVESSTLSINEQNKYLGSIDQEELQKNSDYLNNAVLRDKKSYLLVGIIRAVANKFNYQVGSFSLTPGELKDDELGKATNSDLKNMTRMPISLVLNGPKSQGLALVSALEKTLPILFIDKYETKTSGDTTELTLTIYSYYISDDVKINTDSISLSDLILSKDESALVDKISTFTKIDENQSVGTSQFQQYTRENPFSL